MHLIISPQISGLLSIKRFFLPALFAYSAFFSHYLFSLPEPYATTLPLPAYIEEGDQIMLEAILSLQVFRDVEKKDLYYYVPPFLMSQHEGGALSFKPDKELIENFAKLRRILWQRNNYTKYELERLEKELSISTRELEKAYEKLTKAEDDGNEQEILFWRKIYAVEQQEQIKARQKLEKAQNLVLKGQSLLRDFISESFNEKALILLEKAGFAINPSLTADANTVFAQILEKALEMSMAYGGYMSFSVFAGLSEWDLLQLRRYKAKYMPHIKILLLPIDKITLFPLITLHKDKVLGANRIELFKNEEEMPDYLGSTLYFNMTVLAAYGWAERLGPHIIPLGIRATLKEKTQAPGMLACTFDERTVTDGPYANFCLSYEEKSHGYNNCSRDQLKLHKPLTEALEEVASSPICKNESNPFVCGALRSKAGLL